jgi:hypothetical protein
MDLCGQHFEDHDECEVCQTLLLLVTNNSDIYLACLKTHIIHVTETMVMTSWTRIQRRIQRGQNRRRMSLAAGDTTATWDTTATGDTTAAE